MLRALFKKLEKAGQLSGQICPYRVEGVNHVDHTLTDTFIC